MKGCSLAQLQLFSILAMSVILLLFSEQTEERHPPLKLFGAHQVIIVQSEEAKKNIPDVLKAGIVLTVFEALLQILKSKPI